MIFNPTTIREQLKALGKTQEELAYAVGVSAGTVNRWLMGKHIPLKIYQRKIMEVIDTYGREHTTERDIQDRSCETAG